MAALFDTTVGVLLLRRKPVADATELILAAKDEIAAGTALLAAPAAAELLLGERRAEEVEQLFAHVGRVPTAILSTEAARFAGSMGAFLMMRGAAIPFPDLLIAATAVWLGIPLLAWDADYSRSRRLAVESASDHPGAHPWRTLQLHRASLRT